MRGLHRDMGYLVIGLTLIYSLSGIILIYRNHDILKVEKQKKQKLEHGIPPEELKATLRVKVLNVEKIENDIMYFDNGTYNTLTGETIYTVKEVIFPVNKFIEFHKSSSSKGVHIFGLIYGLLLLFLSISSFWMFKKGTKNFKRSWILTGAGIVISLTIFLLL